jgi:hypothetical protein
MLCSVCFRLPFYGIENEAHLDTIPEMSERIQFPREARRAGIEKVIDREWFRRIFPQLHGPTYDEDYIVDQYWKTEDFR